MERRYSLEITENYFDSIEEMFATLSELGYSAVDYSGAKQDFSSREEERGYCDQIRKFAKQYGFELYQMHAPIVINQPEEYFLSEDYKNRILKSFERGARLGIRNIVIHPFVPEGLDFFRNASPYDYSKLKEHNKEVNFEFFMQFRSFLKQEGLTACIENLFAYDILLQRHVLSVCADPDEMNEYIDALGDDCFAACYDTGHLNLFAGDEYGFIKKLGKRVRTLHLNDSWGKLFKGMDWHLMPGQGDVNWAAVRSGLEDTGYAGTLNAEVNLHAGAMLMPMLRYIIASMKAIFENPKN